MLQVQLSGVDLDRLLRVLTELGVLGILIGILHDRIYVDPSVIIIQYRDGVYLVHCCIGAGLLVGGGLGTV